MQDPIEFSDFYNLLNSVKEGKEENKKVLDQKIKEYEDNSDAKSFLSELGQTFLRIGILNLYKYAKTKDIKSIGNLTKEEWEKLAEKNEEQLPQYLANNMISHAKDNNLPIKLGEKWKVSRREINKHITPMARYITEGLIDVLE